MWYYYSIAFFEMQAYMQKNSDKFSAFLAANGMVYKSCKRFAVFASKRP